MPEPLYHRDIFCVMSKRKQVLDYFADIIDKTTNLIKRAGFWEESTKIRFTDGLNFLSPSVVQWRGGWQPAYRRKKGRPV